MYTTGVFTGRLGHIPSLNGLRAVAILAVLWAHAQFPGRIAGSMGVALFFFLSGFLITTLLRVEGDRFGRISLRTFYLRRLLRIFPPLYIALALAIALTLIGALPDTMSGAGLAASATFLANYWIVFNGPEGIPDGMGILWSLAVEEHFYLVFPVLYIAMRMWMPRRRHQVILLVSICIAILLWRCGLGVTGADPVRLYYATDTRADAILWGSVLAIGFNPVYGEVRLPRGRWWGPAIALTCGLVFFASSRTPQMFHYTVGFTIQSLAAFGIFIPLILAPDTWLGRIFNLRVVAWVGLISYSLYLLHLPAIKVAETWVPGPHFVGAALALATAVLVAWGIRRWVEIPLERVRKRFSRAGEEPEERPIAGQVDDHGAAGARRRVRPFPAPE